MELDFNISFSSISGPYLVKEHKTPLVEGGKSLLFALAVAPLGRHYSKMGTDLRVRLLSREDNDPKLPKKTPHRLTYSFLCCIHALAPQLLFLKTKIHSTPRLFLQLSNNRVHIRLFFLCHGVKPHQNTVASLEEKYNIFNNLGLIVTESTHFKQ